MSFLWVAEQAVDEGNDDGQAKGQACKPIIGIIRYPTRFIGGVQTLVNIEYNCLSQSFQ